MSTLPPLDIEECFQHYQPELVGKLKRIVGCAETAADLAQETYLRVMRLARTEDIEHPRAYLHRIATNLAFDHLRKEKLRTPLYGSMEEATDVPSLSPAVTDEIYGKQRLVVFQRALKGLDTQAKAVLLLRRVHGYTHEQIARHLGLTKRQVENHLAKALYHCQKFLQEHVEESS